MYMHAIIQCCLAAYHRRTIVAASHLGGTGQDNGDGTYLLTWKCKKRGRVDVKVLINGHHVRGSPMKLDFISTQPELHKTILGGEGLRSAVAGQPTPIILELSDQYGNPSTPGSYWRVGLAITNSKKKVHDIEVHGDFTGEWSDTPGQYIVTYIAKQAGTIDLHIWSTSVSGTSSMQEAVDKFALVPAESHGREPFPGSPFPLHVTAGDPVASKSYLDGWTLAAVAHATKTKATKGANMKEAIECASLPRSRLLPSLTRAHMTQAWHACALQTRSPSFQTSPHTPAPPLCACSCLLAHLLPPSITLSAARDPGTCCVHSQQSSESANAKIVTAGDTVSVRAFGVDQFDNQAHVRPENLSAVVVAPDGTRIEKDVTDVTLRNAKAKGARPLPAPQASFHPIAHGGNVGLHSGMHAPSLSDARWIRV